MANAYFGRASSLTEIWMDRVNCNGNETSLEDCGFNGWGERFHTCRSHRDDVSVVCTNGKFFGQHNSGAFYTYKDIFVPPAYEGWVGVGGRVSVQPVVLISLILPSNDLQTFLLKLFFESKHLV